MTRNIEFAPGEYFHLYNRGTERRTIFSSETDYERMLALLYLCNGTIPVRMDGIRRKQGGRALLEVLTEVDRGIPLVDICAYCFMPNHFHILVHEKEGNGISKFMQKIGNGYTGYFNTRYERTGTLFQGKFKATHVDNDRYLKYLIAYIHLNPIKLIDPRWKENGIQNKKKALTYLDQYQYSSYLDYRRDSRTQRIILNQDALPQYFETPKDFAANISEWLDYKPD